MLALQVIVIRQKTQKLRKLTCSAIISHAPDPQRGCNKQKRRAFTPAAYFVSEILRYLHIPRQHLLLGYGLIRGACGGQANRRGEALAEPLVERLRLFPVVNTLRISAVRNMSDRSLGCAFFIELSAAPLISQPASTSHSATPRRRQSARRPSASSGSGSLSTAQSIFQKRLRGCI